ncbi:uncharacterized protein LOC117175229 [Belonocnema kinseyi]|uniref:uncharacterized protein LOC117175229 n=1 Tax=Belonocnema kinseyi TaxID=2817044 RepID=UPI00143D84EB|nr:uncharacterized protein LOC117175229 [Belonocnema kinseyi]
MKYLLCCLLTFCVFENAYARKLEDQLNDVYNNGVKEVNDKIANPILADIQTVDNGKGCYQKAQESMQQKVDSITHKLDRCRVAGRGIRNVEIAKKCSRIEISRFEDDANDVKSTAETCIQSSKI